MATKTITIDMEAYRKLKAVQKKDESFSQTIKRVVWDPNAFLKVLEESAKDPLSDEAVEAVEQVIAARGSRRYRHVTPARRRPRGDA